MCPKGNYALYANTEPKAEVQAVIITNVFTPGTGAGNTAKDFKTDADGVTKNGQFALTFRSTLNEEFTTKTLNVYNLTEDMVADALNSLPNKVIEEAEVVLYRNLSKYNQTAAASYENRNQKLWKNPIYPYTQNSETSMFNYSWYDTDLVILITYSGSMTTGDQFALECKTAYCDAGCQPKLDSPLDFKIGSKCNVVNNFETAYGLNIECSGRGSCDYTAGLCECYEGYTDEFCSTQTALI